MARHLNQGYPISTFYYGQDYMGSLGALLVAVGFRLLSESVDTIRVVQMVLYSCELVLGYALAFTITGSRRIAAITLLLLAIPTALGTIYTSIAIGGYNELIILSSLVLLLSWQVTVNARRESWRWLLLGLAVGLGWWVNGAIVTAALMALLLGLWYFSPENLRGYGLAVIGFAIGSAPWWLYNLQHDWAALEFLLEGYGSVPGEAPLSALESLIALLALGLPTLYGLRYPWSAGFIVSLVTTLASVVYLALITDLLVGWLGRWHGRPLPDPPHFTTARRWVWLIFGVFLLVFVLSSFVDATGRYLMPLWTPAAIGIAFGLERLRRAGWAIPAAALALLLVMQGATVIQAARSEIGLTQQLVERLRVPAEHDAEILNWLAEQDITRGYASYWTSFRLMFLSGERVIFDTSLPYNEKGYQPQDNRYLPYVAAVGDAASAVWITQNFPVLDALIEERLASAGITFQTRDFGRYRVYYELSRPVSPLGMGLDDAEGTARLAG